MAPALTVSDMKEAVKIMVDEIEWPCDKVRGNPTGVQKANEGDGLVMLRPSSSGSTVKEQSAPALRSSGGGCGAGVVTAADKDEVVSNENGRLRIRYLTPRECLRLQAFPDDAIDKMIPVLSKSALYKVAGNSIAVCCLKAIFKGIYIDKTFKQSGRQVSLNRWFNE